MRLAQMHRYRCILGKSKGCVQIFRLYIYCTDEGRSSEKLLLIFLLNEMVFII